MQFSDSREKVVRSIQSALKNNKTIETEEVDQKTSVYVDPIENSIETFSNEITKVNGNFKYCENVTELQSSLKALISEKSWKSVFCLDISLQKILSEAEISYKSAKEDFLGMEVGITGCEFLIARFGSVMISSKSQSGRRMNVYSPINIVVANTSQLVNELEDAYTKIAEKYKEQLPSMISLITGPSRTADIEKTLVLGAHGPKELYVFLVNDKNIY